MRRKLRRRMAARGVLAFGLAVGGATAVGTVTPASASAFSVSLSGIAGPGVVTKPIVTMIGTFAATPPTGTTDNNTRCGEYTANGDVYGKRLYFVDHGNFEAGYSTRKFADCIGLIILSWARTKVVLQFGEAYGLFAHHWYLSNGDSYTIDLYGHIWDGTVSGLS